MKQSNHYITFVFGLLIMLFTFTVPAFGVWTPPTVDYGAKGIANQASCEALVLPGGYVGGLTDATFHKPVTNFTATWKTTTSGATFCQVVGWMWPEIKFQVTMPTVWNERYQMNGGGGWDGGLNPPNCAQRTRLRDIFCERRLHVGKLAGYGHIRHGRTVLQHILQ